MTQQYGTVKVDVITYTSGTGGSETDQSITVSSLATISRTGIIVTGDIEANNITANSGLNVGGLADVSGLVVGQDATITGNLVVGSGISTSSLVVQDNATVSGNLGVSGLATVSGLTVTGTTSLNNLTVTGATNLENLAVSGNLTVTGNTTVSGSLEVSGNAEVEGDLQVSGNTTISGNTTVSGSLEVSGNTEVEGNLTVSGDVTVTGDLAVDGNIDASGVIISGFTGLFASGVQGSPSISFIGDEDTGIYNPESNGLAVSTSGNRRLQIQSDGKITVGFPTTRTNYIYGTSTVTPQVQIERTTASASLGIVRNASNENGPSLYLGKTRGSSGGDNNIIQAGDRCGSISFNGSDGNNLRQIARIDAIAGDTVESGTVDGSLEFYTTAQSGTVSSQRMIIDSSGRVAIGTDTSNHFFKIRSGQDTTTIYIEDPTNSAFGAHYSFYDTPNTCAIGGVTSDTLNNVFGWDRDATKPIFLSVGGNLGVGTESPGRAVHISGNSSDPNVVRIESPEGQARIEFENSGVSAASNVAIGSTLEDLQFQTNGTERARITESGNFGIGNYVGADVSELLTVQGSEVEALFTNTKAISDTGGDEQVFKLSVSGQKNALYGPVGSIVFRQDDITWSSVNELRKPTRLEFCVQNNATTVDASVIPRVVIDQSGWVGMGTTDPNAHIHVSGLTQLGVPDYIFKTTRQGGTNLYSIYYNSSGNVVDFGSDNKAFVFSNQSNSTEAARIDTNARVLVGTSSSRQNYYFASASVNPLAQIEHLDSRAALGITRNSDDGNGPSIYLGKSRSNVKNGNDPVELNDRLGSISFNGASASGTTLRTAARIDTYVDVEPAGTGVSGRIAFFTTPSGSTSPSECMRINSNGTITFNGNATVPASGQTGVGITDNSLTCARGASGYFARFYQYDTATQIGSIQNDGGTGTLFNETSDYRLKENVVDLDDAIERVKKLKPRRFNFISNPERTIDGFVAHEAQEVVPESVTGEKDAVDEEGKIEPQAIDKSRLVPLLTAALQEAISKIEDLEQRLEKANL